MAELAGQTGVFLDASVIIAAAGSPSGGSAASIALIQRSARFHAFVSVEVMAEAFRNLDLKFPAAAVARVRAVLTGLDPTIISALPVDLAIDIPLSVAEKDHHVLYASLTGDVAICLTLDRRHLLTDELQRWAARHSFRLMTPGSFLQEVRGLGY